MNKRVPKLSTERVRANIINDKTLRKLISKTLREYNKELRTLSKKTDQQSPEIIKLEHFDSIGSILLENRILTEREVKTALGNELSIAYLGILLLFFLWIAFEVERKSGGDFFIPRDWINPNGVPDPNLVLQGLLVQLVNYSLSTIHLIEAGLNNPARAMLRNFTELSWLFLVVITDKEKMKAYMSNVKENAVKAVWEKDFTPTKLRASLLNLGNYLGLPTHLNIALENERKEMHEFSSMVLHHSYLSVVVGAFAQPFDEHEEGLRSSLLGAPNKGLKSDLDNLNGELIYIFMFFFAILDKIDYHPPTTNSYWNSAFSLYECFKKISSQKGEAKI